MLMTASELSAVEPDPFPMGAGTLDTKDYLGWLLAFLHVHWGIFMDLSDQDGKVA